MQVGLIAHSHSPFASPGLLVKKKDGSWRFCIDYRQLNVITVRNKHPMPIVDELLDELAGAAWFTKLDFKFGYHQACMAATYHRVKQLFAWPSLKQSVQLFVQHCQICQ